MHLLYSDIRCTCYYSFGTRCTCYYSLGTRCTCYYSLGTRCTCYIQVQDVQAPAREVQRQEPRHLQLLEEQVPASDAPGWPQQPQVLDGPSKMQNRRKGRIPNAYISALFDAYSGGDFLRHFGIL